MNALHVDALIDLAFGALLFAAIVLIVAVGTEIGLAFGFGVLVSYAVHVVWKMARFDPAWMDPTVEETITETVKEQVDGVQEQVQAVEERIERRPREDEVEELIEESVPDDASP